MARLFDDASSQYLSNANAIVTAYPFTMGCWGRSNDITVNQAAISIGDTATDNERWEIVFAGFAAGDPIQARSRAGGTTNTAATTTGFSANTWHHACGVFASATSRTAYIDGGSAGTNTQNNTPSGLDTTQIGAGVSSLGASLFFSGRIAEVFIYNVALSAAEVAALAKGVSPLRIRRANLVFYAPLYGVGSPEPDYSGSGFHMTLNAAPTQVDHAPVMAPFGFGLGWQGASTAAAVTAGKPWHYYQKMRQAA